MVSAIITSWNEPKTIGKCISSIGDQKFSGIPSEFEIIQISPDKETLDVGKRKAKKLGILDKFVQIKDPRKGKPHALKMAFKKAKGDILILTDGDTFFGKSAVAELLKPFQDDSIGGVSGRPVALNEKDSFMGYIGNLMADVADKRRKDVMSKKGAHYISGKTFYPMSGYIMATKKEYTNLHPDALSDDAYISYEIRNRGKQIAYAPKSQSFVKYPTKLADYYLQKSRSVGGFIQLKQLGVMKKDKQTRTIFIEIPYTLFVLFSYPTTLREFWWSVLLHPVRVILWFRIWFDRVILRKGMPKGGWDRIESTK